MAKEIPDHVTAVGAGILCFASALLGGTIVYAAFGPWEAARVVVPSIDIGSGKLHEWLGAIGSVGAAAAAVWLGLRGLSRDRRDRDGRARLLAYRVVREVDRASDVALTLAPTDEAAKLALQGQVGLPAELNKLAATFDAARLEVTRQLTFDLRDFPGSFGYTLASLVPFFDFLAESVKCASDEETKKRTARMADLTVLVDLHRAELASVNDALDLLVAGATRRELDRAVRRVEGDAKRAAIEWRAYRSGGQGRKA